MIRSFCHKGLQKLFDAGSHSGVEAKYADKIVRILARLNMSESPAEMNVPGFRLHPLKRNLKNFFSISVSENWRIIFRFQDVDAFDVDLTDYH